MGVATTTRPPLPSPTDDGIDTTTQDVATDVSRGTERSSYSIPDDGSPVTIPLKNSTSQPNSSQTSLLIEYFEGGRSKEKASASPSSRPSLRVKVNPSSRKSKLGDSNNDDQLPEYLKGRKPSYTKRISFGSETPRSATFDSRNNHNDNSHSPIQVEFEDDNDTFASDSPTKPAWNASEISSMPGDSMLDAPLGFKDPNSQQDRVMDDSSFAKEIEPEPAQVDTLKAPERTRSISRDRILRKAAEKVSQETRPIEPSTRQKSHRSSRESASREIVEDAYADYKARSTRSSKTYSRPDSGDYRSGTDSSFVKPREAESNVSAASRSSFANNPKLLQTIEDAIKRMILPELNEIKRQQSVSHGDRHVSRSLSKSTSAPQMKQKHSSSKDEYHSGYSKRSTRSSRGEASDERFRDSGTERRLRSGDTRRSSGSSEALTAAALKDHNTQSRERERRERRERRKNRSKSSSRSTSLPTTDDHYQPSKIPPMPMTSDNGDSDLTRDSILSTESTSAAVKQQPTATETGTRQLPVQHTPIESAVTVPPPASRGSNKTPTPSDPRTRTPTQTEPTQAARSVPSMGELKSPSSDRSISTKARSAALTAAGLGGAAGAVYGLDRYRTDRSRSRGTDPNASTKHEASAGYTTTDQRYLDEGPSNMSEAKPSSAEVTGSRSLGDAVTQSADSLGSNGSAQYPLTQKRHQGVNFEKDTGLINSDADQLDQSKDAFGDDEFYEEQSRINNEYRASTDFEDADVTTAEEKHLSHGESFASTDYDQPSDEQQVIDVGANPKYTSTLDGPESAVASLHDDSQVSPSKSYSRSVGEADEPPSVEQDTSRDIPMQGTEQNYEGPLLSEHQSFSRDRWVALRESARALSGSKESLDHTSTPPDIARSVKSEEQVKMGTSGIPIANDPLPEIGHGIDSASDSRTSPSVEQRPSSVLDEPLGDINENRDHWPYEPTPPQSKRFGWVEEGDQDERYVSAGNAALLGAAAGLGIGAVGIAAAHNNNKNQRESSVRESPSQSSTSQAENTDRDLPSIPPQPASKYHEQDPANATPAHMKDEGYISAQHPRSPDSITPLSFSKPPPQLFQDKNARGFDTMASREQDPFVNDKRAKYLSGNSHGMSSPYFDASTGKGVGSIQSKDVVALMDHLTVRDGQRNARDTEILVTLVRSAAEIHNSFDEMKKLIQSQGEANIQNTERGISKILSTPRSQAWNSPRAVQSTEDVSGKKKNIFKRALNGLGSKSSNDINRLEDMLVQLLAEVEGLKDAQANATRSVSAAPRGSLDSYERLRAAPDSAYEPEGQAGTLSTPNRSGYFVPHSQQAQFRMHSGYEMGQENGNRISTVMENDEEVDDFGDGERLLTPTQEAQKQRATTFDTNTTTPRGQMGEYRHESTEITPFTDEKQRKTKSGSSSLWGGIPRISRWSKTTSSSDNRTSIGTTPGRVKDRPYSDFSQSGSDVNVLPPEGAPWVTSDGDRLHSANSLARQEETTQSPLAPNSTNRNVVPTMAMTDDPKYRANRNSLTLQHPQPRQGSTQRHQSHLENEAYAYGTQAYDAQGFEDNGELSPSSDTFGSVPSLARLPGGSTAATRLNASHQSRSSQGYELSPISNEGNVVGQRENVPLAQSGTAYAHSENRYSTDSPIQDAISDEDDDWVEDSAIPLSRKRSPYAPGGLLAPIEERYSMEGDRSSIGHSLSQRSRRESADTKAVPPGSSGGTGTANTSTEFGKSEMLADVAEMDETDRSITPVTEPQPAIGSTINEVRKPSGPRQMPLRGTLRRKPAAGTVED